MAPQKMLWFPGPPSQHMAYSVTDTARQFIGATQDGTRHDSVIRSYQFSSVLTLGKPTMQGDLASIWVPSLPLLFQRYICMGFEISGPEDAVRSCLKCQNSLLASSYIACLAWLWNSPPQTPLMVTCISVSILSCWLFRPKQKVWKASVDRRDLLTLPQRPYPMYPWPCEN